jgi:hypothetical protein
MKITELTQKSHSEQLSEDRSKLDEAFWAPATALAGAGLSYYDLADKFGSYKPWKWTAAQRKQAAAEIAADAALGATGLGLLSVANKARKVGKRAYTASRAAGAQKKADKALAKAGDQSKVTNLTQQEKLYKNAGKAQQKADDKAATAATAAIPAVKKGIIGQAGKAVGLGAIGNAASTAISGKPVVAPSDIPVLGKTASGKPQPNPNRIGNIAKDAKKAVKDAVPYTQQSLGAQGRF